MDCYEKETDCTASLHDPVPDCTTGLCIRWRSLTAAGASVSPLTGDESNVVLWIVVGAVALAGIVGIALYLMKRKK